MSAGVEVVRTYLELRSPEQLRGTSPSADDPDVRVVRRDTIAIEYYRRLYRDVGRRWHWTDRDAWSDERLATQLADPRVSVWACLSDDATAGFFELERHDEDDSVEIVYFGLVEGFIGRGIGKAMLVQAVREAWALAPSRVWLHTCTLDSPTALPNYRARGFEPFHTETYVVQLP